jgi:hypothetical protein
MKFLQGEWVKHPEWGIGQVLEDSFEEKVWVFFVGIGKKRLQLSSVNLIKVQEDEAVHLGLDNLNFINKGKAAKYRGMSQLIEHFRRVFPEGFYGDDYLQMERNYKVDAHKLLVNLLEQESFSSLLASHNYHEICKRSMQVVNKTNLIFPNEKMSLRDGLKSEQHEQPFSRTLYSLLYGEDELEKRFNAFSDCLMNINAAKWTIATYFLFMAFPNDHMFLKPAVTQEAAEICGFELNYRSELNWLTYHKLLEFSQYLFKELSDLELSDLKPRDMIDVQSFIWCTARISKGEYGKT